ncbi:unnamed protein product [Penicillium pancosmium]
MSDENSRKEGSSEENPVIISDDEDSDSDTTHTMTPHFSGALDQGFLQNVPQNFRLDGTAPISTSAGSSKRQCLESAQPFRENRARAHSKCRLFKNMHLQLISHEYFSLLGPLEQQQYFNKISAVLHHWQDFGNSCPRIDKFILSHYDKFNRLTATEQETAALLKESIERKWAPRVIQHQHVKPEGRVSLLVGSMIIFDGMLPPRSLSLSLLKSLGDATVMTLIATCVNMHFSSTYPPRYFCTASIFSLGL